MSIHQHTFPYRVNRLTEFSDTDHRRRSYGVGSGGREHAFGKICPSPPPKKKRGEGVQNNISTAEPFENKTTGAGAGFQ